jgi:hypothetical protein
VEPKSPKEIAQGIVSATKLQSVVLFSFILYDVPEK